MDTTTPVFDRQPLSIAPVVGERELPSPEEPPGQEAAAFKPMVYTIRIATYTGLTRCARCDIRFRAAGPTGHADEMPICDRCMLECQEDLGLVLALVAVARGYAGFLYETPREHWEALVEVGVFARIYNKVASSRFGAARRVRVGPGRPARF